MQKRTYYLCFLNQSDNDEAIPLTPSPASFIWSIVLSTSPSTELIDTINIRKNTKRNAFLAAIFFFSFCRKYIELDLPLLFAFKLLYFDWLIWWIKHGRIYSALGYDWKVSRALRGLSLAHFCDVIGRISLLISFYIHFLVIKKFKLIREALMLVINGWVFDLITYAINGRNVFCFTLFSGCYIQEVFQHVTTQTCV